MQRQQAPKRQGSTMRKLKVILSLVILGLMALTGWAYLGEYTPAPAGMSIPLVAAEPAAGAADGN